MEKPQYHTDKFLFLPEGILNWLQPRTMTNLYNSSTSNRKKKKLNNIRGWLSKLFHIHIMRNYAVIKIKPSENI